MFLRQTKEVLLEFRRRGKEARKVILDIDLIVNLIVCPQLSCGLFMCCLYTVVMERKIAAVTF